MAKYGKPNFLLDHTESGGDISQWNLLPQQVPLQADIPCVHLSPALASSHCLCMTLHIVCTRKCVYVYSPTMNCFLSPWQPQGRESVCRKGGYQVHEVRYKATPDWSHHSVRGAEGIRGSVHDHQWLPAHQTLPGQPERDNRQLDFPVKGHFLLYRDHLIVIIFVN